MEVLRDTLKKLNAAKKINSVITVKKTNSMKNFVQVLVDNNFIEVVENSAVITIKPTIEAVEFSPLYDVTEHTGQKKLTASATIKDLKTMARKVLPSLSGVILLTTKQGIMTHSDALNNKMGGIVIGLVY